MRKVARRNDQPQIAWAPYEEDCPIVSRATIAQTVKKIMSNRKRDFLSLRVLRCKLGYGFSLCHSRSPQI